MLKKNNFQQNIKTKIFKSDDENEHDNNQDLNGELNDSDAQNCQPIQFNSITFVVNSRSEIANNQWIILYLIEKISEFHRKNVSSSVASESKLEIAIYDIVSNELAASDELSVSVLFNFGVSFLAFNEIYRSNYLC
jgi:hypothetical protein